MNEPSTEDVIARLESAKACLLENGWTQGYYANKQNQVCLDGALLGVHYMPERGGVMLPWGRNRVSRRAAQAALAAVIDLPEQDYTYTIEVGGPEAVIHVWNDNPARTFGEVIDAIDRAVIHVKEEARC